jgi:hypothetical protein
MDRPRRESRQHNGITLRGLSRWFCKLGIEDAIPDHSAFSRARNERFREGDVFRRIFERVVAGGSKPASLTKWPTAR